ncbi:MAG: hypothetical protein GF308_00080 [Candidatus Heimdallarchaeota archaeon]|nr:hypothetical protein [Candidatus Heimdallarchaeota archaeon]
MDSCRGIGLGFSQGGASRVPGAVSRWLQASAPSVVGRLYQLFDKSWAKVFSSVRSFPPPGGSTSKFLPSRSCPSASSCYQLLQVLATREGRPVVPIILWIIFL